MKTAATSAGAVLLAGLAHVPCCGLNLALILGSAGSGMTWLEGLAPHRPWLLGFSVAMAALTLFLAFRPHKAASCGECCSSEAIHSRRQGFKKAGAVLVAALSLAGVFMPAPHHHHDHEGADHASRSVQLPSA